MNAPPFAKYLMTVGELHQKTGISSATIRIYADLGLVECFYTSRGDRLFLQAATNKALKVFKERTGKDKVAA